MEKISWVNREMKRTRKLPSRATMITTMTTSHAPTQTLPTIYSMPWDLQNWMMEMNDDLNVVLMNEKILIELKKDNNGAVMFVRVNKKAF